MADTGERLRGRPFPEGVSGNPAGRSRRPDVAARDHAAKAVEAFAAIVGDPAVEASVRVSAAAAILKCGEAHRARPARAS